ncbi:hypothetical protein [Pedobacter endophyticus]|uniref:Uncharacterized protein n=1 Tax=Pedobacter endophyticus TaxID=2789740 RepID=A0A7S9L172_9SPHI|nr:hypothetical protein [Pedobacter endophyticus]QPH40589.1 hypothetical protein IZT61_04730 [Pedobacter endophyticus]
MNKSIYANDFQILNTGKGRLVLLLVCTDQAASEGLSSFILSTGKNFQIIFVVEKDGLLTLNLDLYIKGYLATVEVKSSKNAQTYKHVDIVYNEQITHLSTGWFHKSRLMHDSIIKITDKPVYANQ